MRDEKGKEFSDLEYRFSDDTPITVFENLTITFESVQSPYHQDTFFSRVKIDFFNTDDESFSPEKSLDLSFDPSKTIDLDLQVETVSLPFSKILNLQQREALVKLLQKEKPGNQEEVLSVIKKFSLSI